MTQDQRARFLLVYAVTAAIVSLGTLFEAVWFPLTLLLGIGWVVLIIALPGGAKHGGEGVQ